MPDRYRRVLADRIAHLPADAWDALTLGRGVFLQRRFLSALERACPDNLASRYVVLFDGDVPVAALVLQLVRVEGRVALPRDLPLGQWVDERALVLGNLAAWGETGLAMRADLPREERALLWAHCLDLMDRLRRFEKADGVINVSFLKDACAAEHQPVDVLLRRGYRRVPAGADLQLHVDPAWQGPDGWLQSLASKRRRAVKKTREDLHAAGYRAQRLDLAQLELHCARLDALYGAVWANADVRPLRLSGRFFVELQRALGDDCVVTGLFRDSGALDAFSVTLRSDDTAVGYYLGFDRTVDAPLYLGLLQSIIDVGLRWPVRLVSMGRTAEEPKARLGCVPGGNDLWVKHRTPPLNWAVGALLQSMPASQPGSRRAFKNAPLQERKVVTDPVAPE